MKTNNKIRIIELINRLDKNKVKCKLCKKWFDKVSSNSIRYCNYCNSLKYYDNILKEMIRNG
jgi:hypothetical protein